MVDLRASRVSASVTFSAPAEGRQLTRVNWLLRQLKDAPDELRIDAITAWSRGDGTAELLKTLRADPALLVADPKRDIRSFTLTMSKVAGTKRGQGRGSFVGGVLDLIDAFYRDVVQVLRPWTPSAPKVKTLDSPGHDGAAPDPTPPPQLPPGDVPVQTLVPEQPSNGDESTPAPIDRAELVDSPQP